MANRDANEMEPYLLKNTAIRTEQWRKQPVLQYVLYGYDLMYPVNDTYQVNWIYDIHSVP